jgi:glycosyltransferase involved in cell wall biosynthesis
LIVLLEPPRPEGLPSGGFRYQQRIVAALGPAARRVEVAPTELRRCVRLLQHGEPDTTVIVDGWFCDLLDAPLPPKVTALLHVVPARTPWSEAPLHVVATGQPTASAVAAAARRVDIVRPGIDGYFTPQPRRGDPTLAFVCAGTICPAKGQRRLVAMLRALTTPWRLTLVGSTTRDPGEVAALRREAAGLPVTVLDAVPAERLAELYREHDVFASLSRSESFGMAAAEGVAAGLVLFGLDTGELATFGDERSRALLPPDANDDDVRARLRALAADPPPRGRRTAVPRSWHDAATELRAAIRAAD